MIFIYSFFHRRELSRIVNNLDSRIDSLWVYWTWMFIFTFHGFIKNRPNDQLPIGLLAQLVRALHLYRRGHRARIPYKPDLFQAFFSQLQWSSFHLINISAVQIYDIHIFILSYSQLSPCGHLAITDTPLLRTGAKSPAETAKKCIEISLAIADSRCYGIADTSRGPKVTFLLFYSRYNRHLGRILLFVRECTLKIGSFHKLYCVVYFGLIRYFLKWRNNIAKKKYRAVMQNL